MCNCEQVGGPSVFLEITMRGCPILRRLCEGRVEKSAEQGNSSHRGQ